jgi:Zn-dependent protease with chaperone function
MRTLTLFLFLHGAIALQMSMTSHPKVRFPGGLPTTAFRHPHDQSNTRRLQASALGSLEGPLRRAVKPVEEGVFLDNLATSVRVSAMQLPELHYALVECADILGLQGPLPELYVKQNPSPNAYTLALSGGRPFIVVHSSLLAMCSLAEAQAVLAHECGHLKCEHGLWLSLANLASGSAAQLPVVGRLVDVAARRALMEWQRAAEFSCDRAALLVAQDSGVVVSALLKLTGGGGVRVGSSTGDLTSGSSELSAAAYLAQAADYTAALKAATPAVRAAVAAAGAGRTHPLPVLRVLEVDQWAKSAEYHGLLARGRAQRSPTPATEAA